MQKDSRQGQRSLATVDNLLLGHKRLTLPSGSVLLLDSHNRVTYFNVLGRDGYRGTLRDSQVNETLVGKGAQNA